eukprot:2466-Amphidinium_carterae.1
MQRQFGERLFVAGKKREASIVDLSKLWSRMAALETMCGGRAWRWLGGSRLLGRISKGASYR